jgi:hypothetical protein
VTKRRAAAPIIEYSMIGIFADEGAIDIVVLHVMLPFPHQSG